MVSTDSRCDIQFISQFRFTAATCATPCFHVTRFGGMRSLLVSTFLLNLIFKAANAISNHSSSSTQLSGNTSDSTPLDCSASWNAWFSGSIYAEITYVSTYTTTYTYHNISAELTTLCDGHPRIVGGQNGLTTLATGTNSSVTSATRNYTAPTPTCKPASTDCSALWNTYRTSPCTRTQDSDCGPCSIWGGTVRHALKPFSTTNLLTPLDRFS